MKEIFIVRHAKSSWEFAQMKDFERPLNNRGERDAPIMGAVLKEHGYTADLILSSPANRAYSTAKIIAEKIAYPIEAIQKEMLIYEASSAVIIKLINQLDDEYDRVFIVGHNPTFTSVIEQLSEAYIGNLPTCGIAGIRFEVDEWKMIGKGLGYLFYYDFPKNHIG